MRIEYNINGEIFKTKKLLTERIKKMLKDYNCGETLNEQDTKIILHILKGHSNYEQKKGIGIKKIYIEETFFKTKGFHIKRIDGSTTDFSYKECLNNRTLTNQIKAACREAISEDILQFKNEQYKGKEFVKCEITGKKLRYNECHIDHEKPKFREIFNEWKKNKVFKNEDINQTKDNSYKTYFTNKKLKKDFKSYHKEVAKLRVLSPEINIAIR